MKYFILIAVTLSLSANVLATRYIHCSNPDIEFIVNRTNKGNLTFKDDNWTSQFTYIEKVTKLDSDEFLVLIDDERSALIKTQSKTAIFRKDYNGDTYSEFFLNCSRIKDLNDLI